MIETEWWAIVVVCVGPTAGIIILTKLSFKLLEVIYHMMEPKFETGIKRVVTVTIIDEDVTRIEEILKTFALSGHKDRRLIGFANRFIEKIEGQRQQVKMLEYEDRRQAMQEWFQELDIDRAAELGKKHKLDEQDERILELTNIVKESKSDELPALEA